MGFFDKLFRKEAPVFTKAEGEKFTLENQDGLVENPSRTDLAHFLTLLLSDSDQFVTLTLQRAKNGVRYMQACVAGKDIIIQLGLESGEQTRLVERTVSEDECISIFQKFFDTGLVDKMSRYKPVQFM